VDASRARDSVVDHHVVRRNDGNKRGPAAESMDDTRLRRMFVERCTTPKYQKMLRERSALPIFAFRDRILECVRAHPVTVLSAETGAGKSTNCGQVRESWSLWPMHAVQSPVPTYVCEIVPTRRCDAGGPLRVDPVHAAPSRRRNVGCRTRRRRNGRGVGGEARGLPDPPRGKKEPRHSLAVLHDGGGTSPLSLPGGRLICVGLSQPLHVYCCDLDRCSDDLSMIRTLVA
jgi:hypothetical protein